MRHKTNMNIYKYLHGFESFKAITVVFSLRMAGEGRNMKLDYDMFVYC